MTITQNLPAVGSKLTVTDPATGQEYVARVEVVHGRYVTAAVVSPRRLRSHLLTVEVGA